MVSGEPAFIDVREDVAVATVVAFIAGGPVPSVDPVLDAERSTRSLDHRLEIGRNAVAALHRMTGGAITKIADQIITQTLCPAFEATVVDLLSAYQLLEPFEGADRAALALAEATVRKAAGVAETGSHTYTLITQSAREVRALTLAPQYDVDNEFAAWRDIHKVWPRE